MRRVSPTSFGIILALPLLLAGGCITDSCGCSPLPPPRAQVVLSGTVRDAAGSVVHRALVRIEDTWSASCEGQVASRLVQVSTNREGRFAQVVRWSEGDKCLRVFADRVQWRPGMVTDTHHVLLTWHPDTEVVAPDSVELTLTLQPALRP